MPSIAGIGNACITRVDSRDAYLWLPQGRPLGASRNDMQVSTSRRVERLSCERDGRGHLKENETVGYLFGFEHRGCWGAETGLPAGSAMPGIPAYRPYEAVGRHGCTTSVC